MNKAQAWSRIVDIGNGASADNILLASYENTGRLWFETYTGGVSNGSTITDDPLPIDRWVHVAAVLNNDKSTNIYFDGVLVKTGSATALPTEMVRSNTWVGRSNWNGDAYFNGSIRDLKIWNDARTSAEVRSDMTLNPSGSDNALAAWYPLSNVESGMVGGQDLSLQNGASIAVVIDTNGSPNHPAGTIWLSGDSFTSVSGTTPVISAGTLVLDGLGGIGTSSAALRTNINSLAGSVGDNGIYLTNNASLTLDSVSDRTGTRTYTGLATGGTSTISTSSGALTVNAAISSTAGNLGLSATSDLLISPASPPPAAAPWPSMPTPAAAR
jgi:hypothetical protein